MNINSGHKHYLGYECLRRIRENLLDVTAAMPRWTKRLAEDDRSALMQALHDLDLCSSLIGEVEPITDIPNQPLLNAPNTN